MLIFLWVVILLVVVYLAVGTAVAEIAWRKRRSSFPASTTHLQAIAVGALQWPLAVRQAFRDAG